MDDVEDGLDDVEVTGGKLVWPAPPLLVEVLLGITLVQNEELVEGEFFLGEKQNKIYLYLF